MVLQQNKHVFKGTFAYFLERHRGRQERSSLCLFTLHMQSTAERGRAEAGSLHSSQFSHTGGKHPNT